MSQKLDEVNQIIKNNYSLKRQATILKKKIQENLQKVKTIIINWEKFNKFYEKLITDEAQKLSKIIIEKENEIYSQRKAKLSQKGYQ